PERRPRSEPNGRCLSAPPGMRRADLSQCRRRRRRARLTPRTRGCRYDEGIWPDRVWRPSDLQRHLPPNDRSNRRPGYSMACPYEPRDEITLPALAVLAFKIWAMSLKTAGQMRPGQFAPAACVLISRGRMSAAAITNRHRPAKACSIVTNPP